MVQTFGDWIGHFIACAGMPMGLPSCQSAWLPLLILIVAVGLLAIAWGGRRWHQMRQRLEEQRALSEQQRAAASGNVTREHLARQRAEQDLMAMSDVTDPQLARKIQAELENRRRERIMPTGPAVRGNRIKK